MLVVSDTSAITNLIQLNQLHLLKKLYSEVLIPIKVFEELSIYENQGAILDNQEWIEVRSVKDKKLVKILETHLDSGEAEAIVLAKELQVDLLIIDERKGRIIAEEYGLKIIGLLGILILSKKNGYIESLKPILDQLNNKIGFRIKKNLYDRILSEVGE